MSQIYLLFFIQRVGQKDWSIKSIWHLWLLQNNITFMQKLTLLKIDCLKSIYIIGNFVTRNLNMLVVFFCHLMLLRYTRYKKKFFLIHASFSSKMSYATVIVCVVYSTKCLWNDEFGLKLSLSGHDVNATKLYFLKVK